jgi:hypothetical protein
MWTLEHAFPGVIGKFMEGKGKTPEYAATKSCQGGPGQRCLGHGCEMFTKRPYKRWWHRLIYKKRYICRRFR